MDKISLFGLVIGLVAILGGQVLEGGHVGSLTQPTALLIVLGGTMGAVMLQSPDAPFVRGVRMARWVWYPPVIDYQQLIKQITGWSQLSRREGLLALENATGIRRGRLEGLLVAQVRERAVGSATTLTIVRDGKRSDVTVTLAERPTTLQ